MYFFGDCPHLSEGELNLAVKNKNTEAVIKHYIPLVLRLARNFGYDRNGEIKCVGLLALTEVAHRLNEEIINIDAYVITWVKGRIRNFLFRRKPMCYFPNEVLEEQKSAEVPGQQTEVDIEEIFEKLPANLNEKIILKCIKEQGYSLKDMVEECGERIKGSRVSQIKQNLLKRIQEGVYR